MATKTGINRKTVGEYIAIYKPAKYSGEGRESIIAPYTDYVMEKINKYNLPL
jgi:hypothetical protein